MTQTVWVSGEGDRYHMREDCSSLRSGQDGGAPQDYELRQVVPMPEAEAQAAGKKPCRGDCAAFSPGN
ncbi:hypothetical protein [Streptomyces sp. NPDC047869]|uniref:hypothetical protein n=1 Tax=Streptomyces sp. NPDC047869 TaxID=3154709 RepID=UPI003452318B